MAEKNIATRIQESRRHHELSGHQANVPQHEAIGESAWASTENHREYISEAQFGFLKGNPQLMLFLRYDSCKKDTEKDNKTYSVCSLVQKKHTTESQGKNFIGECDTRGFQRRTSDW